MNFVLILICVFVSLTAFTISATTRRPESRSNGFIEKRDVRDLRRTEQFHESEKSTTQNPQSART